MEGDPPAKAAGNSPDARLRGWKEISRYFRVDERTVKRWEASRGLPVRRVPGEPRAPVYALEAELATWLASRDAPPLRETIGHGGPPAPGSEPVAPRAAADAAGRAPLSWWALAAGGMAALAAVALLAWPPSAAPGDAVPASVRAVPPLPSDPALAALYLRARDDWAARTPASLDAAAEGFAAVIARDPGFAPAYAGLAETYLLRREFGSLPEPLAYDRAEAAARAALAIAPDLPTAHRALGFIAYWWRGDPEAAGASFRRALALDPLNAQTLHWYGNALVDNGDTAAGLDALRQARLRNPGSPDIQADAAWARWLAGEREGGRAELRARAAAAPRHVSAHTYLALVAFAERDWDAYFKLMERRAAIRADPAALARVQAERTSFRRGGAAALLREIEAVAALPGARPLSGPGLPAAIAAHRGDRAALAAHLAAASRTGERWGAAGYLAVLLAPYAQDRPIAAQVAARRRPSMDS